MARSLTRLLLLLAVASVLVIVLAQANVKPAPPVDETWEQVEARREARLAYVRSRLQSGPPASVEVLRGLLAENGDRTGLTPEDLYRAGALDPQVLPALAATALRSMDPTGWAWEQAAGEFLMATLYEAPVEVWRQVLADVAHVDRGRRTWLLGSLPVPAELQAEANALWQKDLQDLGLPVGVAGDARLHSWVLEFYDAKGRHRAEIARALDGDLRALNGLESWNLDGLARDFPKSRFARACREYAAIRQGGYFEDLRMDRLGAQWEELTPEIQAERQHVRDGLGRESEAWAQWLQRYPDHPGADDATWWRVRTLEWQGRREEALRELVAALPEFRGDGDVQARLHDAFLRMLDVGAKDSELGRVAETPGPLQPALRYALAVRKARQDDYAGALAVEARVDDLDRALAFEYRLDPEAPQPLESVAPWLAGQRERWQELESLRPPALAARLLEPDGWKSDYLALHRGNRVMRLAWSYSDDADRPTAQPDLRWDRDVQRELWQGANAKAHALRLLAPMESEESLALQVQALSRQFTMHPELETAWMHPLWEASSAARPGEGEVEAWYRDRAAELVERLLQRNPGSEWRQPALDALAAMGPRGEEAVAEDVAAQLDAKYPPTLVWRLRRRLGG